MKVTSLRSAFALSVLTVCTLVMAARIEGQNFNPPFPRIGVIYFYEANIPQEIWKYHDLIIIRFYYPQIARKIKSAYPEKIVLATNGNIDGDHLNPPDDWLVNTLDGSCLRGWNPGQHPGDCLYDATDFCPLVRIGVPNWLTGKDEPAREQRWSDYITTFLAQSTDWSVFDGAFFDSWRGSILWYPNYNQVDYNRDGIPDAEQTPTAEDYWLMGNRIVVEKLRQKMPSGKVVAVHDPGRSEYRYLNGFGLEAWTGSNWRYWLENFLLPYREGAVEPRLIFIEAKGEPEDYQRMRFLLTTACLVDGYFGMDEGDNAHRYTYIYDEYLANLGYPLGPPEEIRSGVWVRYFENGAVVTNASGRDQTITSDDLSGGPYYRFRGNQDPAFNDGSIFTSVVLRGSGEGNPQMLSGDGILLLRRPATLIAPIIVDNVARNMTTPGNQPATFVGSWTQQDQGRVKNTNAYALNYGWDEYGPPYAFTNAGSGDAKAIYSPRISVEGYYDVYEWHPFHGNSDDEAQEANDVYYEVHHAGGVTSGTIDQSRNQGQWNLLGRFYFAADGAAKVIIANRASQGIVIADAVKFEYVGEGKVRDTEPPAPPRGLRIQNP